MKLWTEPAELDILTFREWKENSVGVSHTMDGTYSIWSRQNRKTFMVGDEFKLGVKIKDKLEYGALLYKIYQDNFDWIQEQHQLWIKEQKEEERLGNSEN